MKAIALLPVAVAAVMTFQIPAASSQEACVKEYSVCMDGCVKRTGKMLQDTCFQSCEAKNNFCAERVYGKRPTPAPENAQASAPVQTVPQQQPAAAQR